MIRKPFFPGVRLLCLLFIALTSLLIFAQSAGAQCTPPSCEEPPYEPPPSGGGGGEGGAWSGYSDGRLNPDMAEYYSIWCANDLIEVWGGIPSPQLVNTIPIVDVLALGDIGSFDAGNGQTVSRTGDVVIISGSGGNGAGPGSKSFSLNECIARNGGTPELPPPPQNNPPPAATETPEEAAARRRQEAQEELDFCFSSYEFFEGDNSILVDCLDFVLAEYRDVLNSNELISLVLMVFCLNIVVGNGILPIGIVAFLGWHRRWLRKQKTLD